MIRGDLVLVKADLIDYVGFWESIEDNVITLKNARTVSYRGKLFTQHKWPKNARTASYRGKLFTQHRLPKNMEPLFGSLIEKLVLICGKGNEVIRFTDTAAKFILANYDWCYDWEYDYCIENKVLIRTENGIYEGLAVDTLEGRILLSARHVYVPISTELTDIIQPIISDPYLYEKGPPRKNKILINDVEELVYYKDYIMNWENEYGENEYWENE